VPAATPASAQPEGSDDLFGDLLDNPLLLPAGGALAALLGLLGWQRMRRRRKQAGSETSFLESRLQPDSFFGVSGGQRVDTRDDSGAPSSMSFSLSQLDAIGDVDPVAEADVYLAYGRDLQAEEILKEAIKVAPDRMAIRLKLLEVYAKRRDVKASEAVASEIHALTGGTGVDWAKVQQMGAELEPENQLYQPGGKPVDRPPASAPIPSRDGDTVQQPNRPGRSRFDDDAARPVGAALAAGVAGAVGAAAAAAAKDSGLPPLSSVGSEAAVPARAPAPSQAAAASPPPDAGMDLDIDFDLDAPQAAGIPSLSAAASPAAPAPQPAAPEPSLDFSLPAVSMDFPAPTVAAAQPAPLELGGDLLDLQAPAPAPVAAAPSEPELLDFSLDTQPAPLEMALDLPAVEAGGASGDAAATEALERKLDLADEFRQIGDVEGARELLQEVISQAQGGLKSKAQALLRGLS
jgi:pilus assembly protein FimV